MSSRHPVKCTRGARPRLRACRLELAAELAVADQNPVYGPRAARSIRAAASSRYR